MKSALPISHLTRTMTSFPGRDPPEMGVPAPPGVDDSGLDVRALNKAGGEFLPGASSHQNDLS